MKECFASKIIIVILVFITGITYSQEKIDTSSYYPGDLNFNLIVATEMNYLSEVQRLVEKGASVHSETWEGVTPLMYAVQNENIDIVKFLLEKGADPNKKPLNGVSPIIAAIKTENIDLVEVLIRSEANINAGDSKGVTPLMYAAAFNNFVLADMLIYYDTWVNMRDDDGNTALIVASYFGYLDIVKLLVENGALVNLADNKDFTPLYVAAQKGNMDIVSYLHENGADIEQANKYGYTPLFTAIENQHYEVVKYLMTKSNLSESPIGKDRYLMNVAVKTKNDSIIHLLKNYNYKVDYRPQIKGGLVDYSMHFTSSDGFAALNLGVFEERYKLNLQIGINRRLKPIAVLEKRSDVEYYQYWEKRTLYTFKIGRYIKLYNDEEIALIFNPTLGYGLTSGRYRGTYKRPPTISIFCPGAELLLTGKNIGVGIMYQYADFNTTGITDHRFGFSVRYQFKTNINAKNSKKVIWYL